MHIHTHMHSSCERRTFFCKDISLENSAGFNYIFNWLYFTQCLTSFPLIFDSISSNIDEVLSINPSANVFAFGDFNIHHKDWLIYSGETDRACELCYNLKRPYSDRYLSYSNP